LSPLAVVATARRTRSELMCRQLNRDAPWVRPAWDVALRTQLLEPVGIEPGTGEVLYRLSGGGRRALRVLSLGHRGARDEYDAAGTSGPSVAPSRRQKRGCLPAAGRPSSVSSYSFNASGGPRVGTYRRDEHRAARVSAPGAD
jgi:hypothetical protein